VVAERLQRRQAGLLQRQTRQADVELRKSRVGLQAQRRIVIGQAEQGNRREAWQGERPVPPDLVGVPGADQRDQLVQADLLLRSHGCIGVLLICRSRTRRPGNDRWDRVLQAEAGQCSRQTLRALRATRGSQCRSGLRLILGGGLRVLLLQRRQASRTDTSGEVSLLEILRYGPGRQVVVDLDDDPVVSLDHGLAGLHLLLLALGRGVLPIVPLARVLLIGSVEAIAGASGSPAQPAITEPEPTPEGLHDRLLLVGREILEDVQRIGAGLREQRGREGENSQEPQNQANRSCERASYPAHYGPSGNDTVERGCATGGPPASPAAMRRRD